MRGQSLLETALILPLLIMLVMNVVNLAYFFLMTTNLTGTSRTATIYSIMGSATPSQAVLPAPGSPSSALSISYLAWGDMKDIWGNQASSLPAGVTIQICTPELGINATGTGTSSQVPKCQSCDSTGCSSVTASPDPDPEAPNFVLNEIWVTYQFQVLFPGKMFNIPLQAFSSICNSSGTCTFTRVAEMRAMN